MSHIGEMESVLFKPVEGGGYVFQPPSPWLIGGSQRYLVNAAQKDQLLALLATPRPVLRGLAIVAGILIWAVLVATMMWAVSPHENPEAIDIIAMVVLILVPMALAFIFMLRQRMRRLQPLLIGLPRTDERITSREQRQSMADAVSMKRLVMIGGLWTVASVMQGVALVIRNSQHPLFSDAQSFIGLFVVIMAAGLAVRYFWMAIHKRR
jgi:hypothetical protein